LFSNYLISLLEKLQFVKAIIVRFFVLLFRKRKKIELLYFYYDTKHLFDNSFVIVDYKFNNAIYYRFGNYRTLEKQIKIFNLKNIDREIEFVVYGFFQRKNYKLKFKPELTLNADSLKTKLYNLSIKLEEQIIPKLINKKIYCEVAKPLIKFSTIKMVNQSTSIQINSYNQNEFI